MFMQSVKSAKQFKIQAIHRGKGLWTHQITIVCVSLANSREYNSTETIDSATENRNTARIKN
jgi:hypothetical protein